MCAFKLLYTHEPPTGVYFFLAELLDFLARAKSVDLSALSKSEKKEFVRASLPRVWYDCACTLNAIHMCVQKTDPNTQEPCLATFEAIN